MRKPKTKKAATKAKAGKPVSTSAPDPVMARRAKAYSEMENSVCDLARGAELAMTVFDNDRLFLFAVGQLDFMVQRFRDRYYAEEFPGEN
jgi:hypothetical protein